MSSPPRGPITLHILDGRGRSVHRFAGDQRPPRRNAERYFAEGWLGRPEELTGLNDSRR